MKIGFIGAGKVGTSLGKYFSKNGFFVTGYYSKNSAKISCEFTQTKEFSSLASLFKESDFIFITTPDDMISSIIKDITSLDLRNKLICHTSGSLSSKVFSPLNNSGAFFYSIHPMFAFSDKFHCYKNLNTAYFSIEGNTARLLEVKSFIKTLGNPVFVISEEKKPIYHLANVMASNLVLSLLQMSTSYLSQCGISSETALEALMPLIENNIQNLKNAKSFSAALTGPIERKDLNTIKHHVSSMSEDSKELYKLLSQNLVRIAMEKHPEESYAALHEYLGGI